jgi:hypothetical protein
VKVSAWRRAVDIFLGLLVAVSSVQSGLEGTQTLGADQFESWKSVVGCGQILLSLTGAGYLLALWRRPAWAMPLMTGWALAALVTGSVGSFAWSEFAWTAFVSAVLGTLALDAVMLWWANSLSRRRRPTAAAGA